jgi:hypothetical protein
MKDSDRAGWGWCCADGQWDGGVYGSAGRRKAIDELEGDAVLRAARALSSGWRGKRVPFYIDNSAFQLSLKKGWSKAKRLSSIIKLLFAVSSEADCVIVPIWISTHDNIGSDAISRGDIKRFQEWSKDHAHGDLRKYRSAE